MKRVLAILLTALMIVSLAACGAENGESTSGPASEPEPVQTSEADPGQTGEASPASSDPAETEGKPASGNPLEGTGFVMPDAATRNYDVQCVEYEVIDGAPEDGYEKKIVVYYETPEDAARALEVYSGSFAGGKYSYTDDFGYKLTFRVGDEGGLDEASSSFSFFIVAQKEALVDGTPVDEIDLEQYVGKYLLTTYIESGEDQSEIYRNGWEDKSLYMYYEITPDGQLVMYSVVRGEKEEHPGLALKEALASETIRLEAGRITVTLDDTTMVFEKTDEIPD